jgi:putative FmdB family regulatory protein
MPFYDYRCNECGHTWDEFQSINARNVPRYEPCPECGSSGDINLIIGKVNLGDPIQLGIQKPPKDVQERLAQINRNAGGDGGRYG